jgi:hypothetical protein
VSDLAGKPSAFFVVPDPWLGQVPSQFQPEQAGAMPGVVTPSTVGTGNVAGRLVAQQSGELSSSALDESYVIVKAGGTNSSNPAEFVFAPAPNPSLNPYQGKDDIRYWWGFHSPFTSSNPGSDNCASVYHKRSRRIYVYGCSSSTSAFLAYRDVDTARYDQWTSFNITLENSAATGDHGAAMVELEDGRIMLIQRVLVGGIHDFDVYVSGDDPSDSAAWKCVSDRIIARFSPDTTFPTHQTAAQIRVARSGEFIRLLFADGTTPGLLNIWLSRDRGMSWQRISGGPTVRDTADTDDRVPFDIIAVDDAGTFLVAAVRASVGAENQVRWFGMSGTIGGILLGDTTESAVNTHPIRAIALGGHPSWLYVFVWWSDAPAAAVNDGWQIKRAPRSGYADVSNLTGNGWRGLPNFKANAPSGADWGADRVTAIWAGPSWFFYGGRKTEAAGTDQTTGTAWYAEAWSERTLGEWGPAKAIDALTTPLFDIFWSVGEGRPSDAGGTAWTLTTVATGNDTISPDVLTITGSAAGDQRYYQIPAAGTAGAWHDTGLCLEFFVRLDSADSTTAADDVAVRIIAANAGGTARRDVSLRISGSSIVVFNNVAGATLATLSGLSIDTGSAGAYTLLRLRWGVNGTLGKLMAYNTSTKTWTETTGSFTATSGAAAATSLVRFGHLGQVQATSMRSYWREFKVTNDGRQLNMDKTFPVTDYSSTPTRLFGAPCSPVPQYVQHGLHVAWSGAGGARGDKYDGVIAYAYPATAVFVDSPRIGWRSTTTGASSLIFYGGDVNAALTWRWRHDAIAVFGCNNRNIIVDYDSSTAFATPTAAQTIDMTAFGTGTTPVTIASVDGNTMVITTPAGGFRWTAGELARGFYVRATSGAASGITLKVTRHLAADVLQFDEETVALATQGFAAGNNLVVFADHGVKLYSAPVSEHYMRIRFSGTEDTAEGYNKLGTVVAGRYVPVDVPFDWAHSDDEQPNVTHYRTRSGIGWAFTEGPSQRTLQARVVGDVERWREKFRNLLSQVSYEERALALVLNDERAVESMLLGRVRSGGALDNVGWWRHPTSNDAHTTGDMTLNFVEEK